MAKAREIPGLGPDVPFARAAGMTVRVRAQELVDHAEGVLDTSDIERVHAMRVASRRLRAVLEIHAACFPPKRFKPVLRDVKALADALGARRDPDVQLDALRAFSAAVGEADRPGVEVFITQLEEEQAEGNATLAAEIERMHATDLPARLRALADLVDPPPPPEPEPEPETVDGVLVVADPAAVPVRGPEDPAVEVVAVEEIEEPEAGEDDPAAAPAPPGTPTTGAWRGWGRRS